MQGTTGEGIKKTPAYETPLDRHGLEKWRKEFWETRTSGAREIWQLLRNACEADHETAQALVAAADLDLPQNSLTTCIEKRSGLYYRVPICCINDPVNYEKNYLEQKLKNKEAPPKKTIKVSDLQTDSVQNIKIKMLPDKVVTADIENDMTIEDLKKLYIAELEKKMPDEAKDMDPKKLRFLCLGKELKDDLFVYSYDIRDDLTIQCMKRQIFTD